VSDNFQKFSDPERGTSTPDQGEVRASRSWKVSPVAISRIVAISIAGLISALLIQQVHTIQVVEKQQTRIERMALQRAQLSAENVQIYLKKLISSAQQFAAKPLLEKALRENDLATLEQFATLLKRQQAAVEYVRFFGKGTAQRDMNAFPPIRFTELEQIQAGERRVEPRPEAVKYRDEWLFNMVFSVPNDAAQEVVGTILVSYSVESVSPVLEQNNIGLGAVVLSQYFGKGVPQVMVKHAGETIAPAQSAAVSGSPWTVEFAPSTRLGQQAEVNIPFVLMAVSALSLGLMALGLWVGKKIGERIVIAQKQSPKGAWRTLTAVAIARTDDEPVSSLYAKTDILDVDIADEDERLLGLQEEKERKAKARQSADITQKEEAVSSLAVPEFVFRAYDIRGVYGKQITEEFALRLGQALGSEALDIGEEALIVARDARVHSPKLTEYLIRGILNSGCNVLNIGTVPTPLLYFATETLDTSASGVMVTASHNPADQNGFKIVMGGKCRSEQDIKSIRSRILSNNVYQGKGEESRLDIAPNYIDAIFSDVALAGDISIVIDAGNAVAGMIAPRLFEELGCHVTPLFCDLDGRFPNHSPDPTIEDNLSALIAKVIEVGADLGIALDGDGDRLVVITSTGKIIWPDRLLMLFAKDIVSRNPGADVVFDVKSTRHLNNCITEVGGRPIMWKTGHSPMKEKMVETGALVGAEYSGHIFIKDRWYGFDDGLYAAARLIEIISLQGESLDQMFEEFPQSPCTPEIRVEVPEEKKFDIINTLLQQGEFGEGKLTSLDGIRVDYSNGWGLVRASNTSAHLTMRFEADDEKALHQLKSLFVQQLRLVDNSITVDWNQKS